MSERSVQETPTEISSGGHAVACFCVRCDRPLYVAESDILFCPVCSSPVSRLDLGHELHLLAEENAPG